MSGNHIDNVLNQWEKQRPELDGDSLGIALLLTTLDRKLRQRTSEALRRLGISTWEYDVLSALRRQGDPFALGATDLAHETRLSSGAMTNRIDKLQARALVERRSNPDDRRGVLVYLTRAGRTLVDEAIATRMHSADVSLAPLDRQQRLQLKALLRRLTLNAEPSTRSRANNQASS